MIVIRGPLWQRLLTAVPLWAVGIMLEGTLLADVSRGLYGPSIPLSLGFGTIFIASGIRAMYSRVVAKSGQLVLHGVLRTRRMDWSERDEIVQHPFLGRPANWVHLSSGRRYLVPLATQIGEPSRLESVRNQLHGVREPYQQVSDWA